MKQSISSGGGGGGGGNCMMKLPTVAEVEVAEILLNMPKLIAKSELIHRYSFTWARKKKRSVLVLKSESSPSASTHRRIDEKLTAAAEEADKSPSTPLCFLPSGSGSDGADKPRPPSSLKKKSSKRKATDELMEQYNEMQKQKEFLTRKLQAMKTCHRELTTENLELKANRRELYYSRNKEDFNLWNNNPMKINLDQQRYHHQQIPSFAPGPPPQPPPLPPPPPPALHCHRLMVDPGNGKLMAVGYSSNSNGGGRCGIFNQMDPRVKIHGENFDFMASSQPFDQSHFLVMDNDLRARNAAAAARRRRIMRMKENRNSSMAMKQARGCR